MLDSYKKATTVESSYKAFAVFQKTDVSSWTDLSRAWDIAKELFGRVDIVCPGAGVFEPAWSSFWNPPGTDTSIADSVHGGHYKSLDINLNHPIRLTQLALEDHLRQRKQGDMTTKTTVVHVSSIAGQASPLWCPLYTVSKHGINGIVRALAPLAERLQFRVVAVAPGLVKTPLWTENPEKAGPIGTDPAWVTSEEVAQVMLDLAQQNYTQDRIVGRPGSQKSEKIMIGGGTILEVSGDRVREVKQYNDSGPQGIEQKDFDSGAMEDQVFRNLLPGFRQAKL